MKRPLRELLSWIFAIGGALVVALLLVTFVFQFTVVIGESMQPTLDDHEVLFVDKLSYRLGDPDRGDVVVCKYPITEGDDDHPTSDNYIKRVIGIPGDTVEISENTVLVNGQRDIDSWMGNHSMPDMDPIQVTDGHYFVLGDNRSNSLDSEEVGLLPRSFIKGRARFILFPLRNIGGIT